MSVQTYFQNPDYLQNNRARHEHLDSLRLSLEGKTVLDVGAGIGDHIQFFHERHCKVTALDARAENLEVLKNKFPHIKSVMIDMDNPPIHLAEQYDVVYCYGLLNHLANPGSAIQWMAKACREILLLQTTVTHDADVNHEHPSVRLVNEDSANPLFAIKGTGCLPRRQWVFDELKRYFPCVYMPITQPDLNNFPTDWTIPSSKFDACAVFIASFEPLQNSELVQYVPMQQVACHKS